MGSPLFRYRFSKPTNGNYPMKLLFCSCLIVFWLPSLGFFASYFSSYPPQSTFYWLHNYLFPSLFIVLPLEVETWCLSDIIKVSNDWLRNCDKISLANILRKNCLFTPHVNVSRSSHVSSCQHNKIQHVAHYPQYYLRLRKIRIISYNST